MTVCPRSQVLPSFPPYVKFVMLTCSISDIKDQDIIHGPETSLEDLGLHVLGAYNIPVTSIWSLQNLTEQKVTGTDPSGSLHKMHMR